jgi:hypothetical protein
MTDGQLGASDTGSGAGGAGLSFFRGCEPVIATVMIQGSLIENLQTFLLPGLRMVERVQLAHEKVTPVLAGIGYNE